MARIRHLSKAPITEALIDLRVRLPGDFDAERFSELKGTLSERYPKVKEHHLFRQKVELGLGGARHAPEDRGIQGLFFRSEDELNVAQFRIDGFTFNRLKPYTSWENVLREARDLWASYVLVASPEVVTRTAVRYINHLAIPRPIRDLSDYLTTPLPVPQDCPGDVESFIAKVVIQKPAEGVEANITQALEEAPDPQSVAIVLDIDVWKRGESGIESNEIWSTFEVLREIKNRIFFGSITEKAARLFE